jgi:hypothetical protein
MTAATLESLILELLAGGAQPSADVKTRVAEHVGCSARTVQRAAMELRGRGQLSVSEAGFPRRTIWAVSSEDTPLRSEDTAAASIDASQDTPASSDSARADTRKERLPNRAFDVNGELASQASSYSPPSKPTALLGTALLGVAASQDSAPRSSEDTGVVGDACENCREPRTAQREINRSDRHAGQWRCIGCHFQAPDAS